MSNSNIITANFTSTPTAPAAPARSARDWVDTKELARLLKAAGWNGKKVTVKAAHSRQYITVTIRDYTVDVAAVEKFCATFNTWEMDMSDYVTGQSINVETTQEVKDMKAAPYIAAIVDTVNRFNGEFGHGKEITGCPGYFMGMPDSRDVYVFHLPTNKRTHNHWRSDVVKMCDRSIKSLAYCLYTLGAPAPAPAPEVPAACSEKAVAEGMTNFMQKQGFSKINIHKGTGSTTPAVVSCITGDGLPKLKVPAPCPDSGLVDAVTNFMKTMSLVLSPSCEV